jgi:hypothetical protein
MTSRRKLMSHSRIVQGLVCAVALATPVMAQNPTQAPAPQGATASLEAVMVRIEGCVSRDVDAPGLKPPEGLRSRAEEDEEYVLTNTRMVQSPAQSSTTLLPAETPTGTAGIATSSQMYQVKDVSKAKLKEEIGRRVQIDGTLEHVERTANPVSFATDLVALRGTMIRRVDGDCPATKK